MDLETALTFAATRRNAVLTTLRRDGRPQQSVIFYVANNDRFTISVTASRAKTANLRRDPRAALFIPGDGPFEWVRLDGTVELSAVDYYRTGTGEHEDWEAYRAAMVTDGRLLATFTATAATGILPD